LAVTCCALFFYRGADKSLARPTSRCILFDGENISFDASLVIYKNSTNIPPIITINRIYESSGSSSPLCLCKSKEGGGVRLKTQLSWFYILLPIVTTCFGLARPSSGRNVVHK
jgi:hypothetical protein